LDKKSCPAAVRLIHFANINTPSQVVYIGPFPGMTDSFETKIAICKITLSQRFYLIIAAFDLYLYQRRVYKNKKNPLEK
ncbi:MAG: hypothetical protein ACYTE8_10400, partial [Planctomycetota bacterium]